MSTAYVYDDNDRITSQGGTSYTYDDNGNTLTESIDADLTTYTYDAKNKLTGVEKLVGGTTSNSSYTYNSDGIRTSQTVEGTETKYVVDSNRDYAQVLFELDSADAVQVQYTYGDDLISQDRSGSVSYYHYDGLGSTRALSNGAGDVIDTYNYEAFGELLNSTGSSDNSYLFTGEQFDSGLGQYYLRSRYYDQGVGRFTQQDTWMGHKQEPITLHKYLYANSDPANWTDPTGNFGLFEASVTNTIATELSLMQVDAGFSALDSVFGATGNTGAQETARTIKMVVGIAALGAGGIQIFKMLSKKFRGAIREGRLRIEDGEFSASEIRSAIFLAGRGRNVVLRNPVGTRAGGGTSDLLVDGVRYDVYTPKTKNASRIISAIAKKNDQAEGIVLDLAESPVSLSDLGNVLARVRGAGATNINDIVIVGK